MTASIILIILLLLASAFFSASETALTAASKPLMHQLEADGDARAGRVNRLRAQQEHLLGAILLGNNMVNILASSVATGLLIALFGEAGVAYAAAGMTVLVLIFGEILPKTYAIHNANRVAPVVAFPLSLLVKLLSPVLHVLQIIVRFAGRLIGARFDTNLAPALLELRGAIEMHGGEEIRHERAMLRSILDLDEVEVGEIMTHRKDVVMIDADQPIDAIIDRVLDSPYTRLPLWRGTPDDVIGILHTKALLRAVRARGDSLEGLDIGALSSAPWFVPDSTSLLDQLHAFRARREHFALVVDEYGVLLGVVTLEDILEEIVGEISDEHDVAVSGVRPQGDGSYVIDGKVTLRDLNRQFEWDLPDEEAATLAGLILHESRQIPEVGQAFLFHGFRFQIVRRHRNQITQVRVTPPTTVVEDGA